MKDNTRTTIKRPQNKLQQVSEPFSGMSIGRKWRIGADPLNIILYRREVSKKTGKERWRAHSYYSTVTNALLALVDQGVRDTRLVDLKIVCAKVEQLRKDIIEAIADKQ